MHKPSKQTLSLDTDSKERALDLLKRVDNDDVHSPKDIVDEWENPKSTINREEKDGLFPQYRGFISPKLILGSLGMEGRLETHRIKEVLVYLLEGKFEVQNSFPPVLQKREGLFYVSTDGHHRCMIAKAIELDELYVEYTVVPSELLE